MYIKLESVLAFPVSLFCVPGNIKNLLSTRAETSPELLCWMQALSWSPVKSKLNLKQQSFPGREIPFSGGSSGTGCASVHSLVWFLPPGSHSCQECLLWVKESALGSVHAVSSDSDGKGRVRNGAEGAGQGFCWKC